MQKQTGLFLVGRGRAMPIVDDIQECVIAGKRKEIGTLIQQGLDAGEDPSNLLGAMVAAMDVIGGRFSRGECFVPEMLVAARTMTAGTEVLKPILAASGAEPVGHAVIGTVKGDMHDIGKKLVCMMIEGKNVDVTDLGVDVSPEQFVDYVKEHPECQVVCLSALLTTTMAAMAATVKAFEDAGLRDNVKIMIGGAPVNQAFCDEIGADAYTDDAGEAAEKIIELLAS